MRRPPGLLAGSSGSADRLCVRWQVSGSRWSVDRRQQLRIDVRKLVTGSVHEGTAMPRHPLRRRGSGRWSSAGLVRWGCCGCHSLGRYWHLAGKGWDAATYPTKPGTASSRGLPGPGWQQRQLGAGPEHRDRPCVCHCVCAELPLKETTNEETWPSVSEMAI